MKYAGVHYVHTLQGPILIHYHYHLALKKVILI
jgi:hypothetical protein